MIQHSNDSFRDRITFMNRIIVGWCPSHRINFKMMHLTEIPSWITIVNSTFLWLKLELSKSINFGHSLNWFFFSTHDYFHFQTFFVQFIFLNRKTHDYVTQIHTYWNQIYYSLFDSQYELILQKITDVSWAASTDILVSTHLSQGRRRLTKIFGNIEIIRYLVFVW